MEEDILYIHYGHKHFVKELFGEIRNREGFPIKPIGGLWGSREDTKFGWKQWCEAEEFMTERLQDSFKFKLNTDRILVISNSMQLQDLPKNTKDEITQYFTDWILLDYEKLAQQYDAMEVLISEDYKLDYDLYGYDCDSIIVFNKDVIEEVQEDKI